MAAVGRFLLDATRELTQFVVHALLCPVLFVVVVLGFVFETARFGFWIGRETAKDVVKWTYETLP